MGQEAEILTRRARAAVVGGVLTLLVLLISPSRAAGAQSGCTPVIGPATTTPGQLAGWFTTTGRQPKLDVSILELATMFVEEGAREGVRGDIAFAQAIVETGYFGFSPSVPPDLHNYSGLGATGGGVRGAAFPDARSGVRAQVQHLRAYADPSLRSAADLRAPLVDPRFRFLVPNPRTVPCWEQFGSGVWAADPTGYGPRVLSVHGRIAAHPVPAVAPAPAPAPAPAEPVVEVPAPVVEAPAPVEHAAPGAAGAEAPLPVEDLSMATLDARPAVASSTGGGLVGAAACVLSGAGLLTLCTTLWWHGRRFARAA